MTAMKDRETEVTGSAVTGNMLTMMSLELNTQARRSLQADQQIIYNFFLSLVRTASPELVLAEFRSLFIAAGSDINSKPQEALYSIISYNNEAEFINTLKRSCYILINKWHFTRQCHAICQLIELFNTKIGSKTRVTKLLRLNNWLNNFVKSKDYEEMKVFALKHESSESNHWSDRYTSYLLVPQYIKHSNPLEQRQAAKILAQQLKEKFKFDLAMYTARAVTPAKNTSLKNPTSLGDAVLDIIKNTISKKGEFNYVNIANIFLNQTQYQTYKQFKQSLQKYLIFSMVNQGLAVTLSTKVSQKLKHLYESDDERQVDRAILAKTCNALIEHLTIDKNQLPSELFILMTSQRRSLTLVIILLKIVLISQQSRTYLEACIAELIQYYKNLPYPECEWVVQFVEIFNIVFTIYSEDVEYNLVRFSEDSEKNLLLQEERYRIFCQVKRAKIDNSQEKLKNT